MWEENSLKLIYWLTIEYKFQRACVYQDNGKNID